MADDFNTLDRPSTQLTDGALNATVRDTGSADSLNVAIVDASGNQITSFSGATQYAEDTAGAPGDQVMMAGVVRKDASGTLVDTDGDRSQLQVNASGGLRVDGSAVTQPVSAASLPLPAGAATEATLATRASEATLASIDGNIDVALSTVATEVTLASVDATLTAIDGNIDVALSTRATEATLGTVATNTGTTATNTGTIVTNTGTIATNTGTTNTNLGAQADAAATTDTGTFSLIALIKRGLQSLTLIAGNGRHGIATLLASAARTTTTASSDQTNPAWLGAHVIIKVTATGGTIALTPTIEAQDPVTTDWYPLLTGSVISSTGTSVLKIYPSLSGVSNKIAGDVLPATWRINVAHGNADSVTYSVAANMLR